MKLTSDWHIHSRNSCDQACMAVADLIRGAAAAGVTDYGLTDHIHTPVNLPDLIASRREFDAQPDNPRFHFGAEVSCVSAWELTEIAGGDRGAPTYGLRAGGPAWAEPAIALTEQHVEQLGIEYVVGGTHWPLYVPFEREAIIRDYHRQNMFLATHPLVDIVAHPWWWMGHWKAEDGSYPDQPWFDDFRCIPESMHREFAAAVIETGTKVEINISACLMNPSYPASFQGQYVDYLLMLRDQGVTFSLGSDCHSATYPDTHELAAGILADAGFRESDFWRLPPRSH